MRVKVTSAGETFSITHIGLYAAPNVAEWKSLLATAQTQLGGISTGFGFIGSPAWAIGGALALGFLENALTSASQKEGVKTLQRAGVVLESIHKSRQVIPVGDVLGIEFANPGSWSAVAEKERVFSLSNLFGSDRKKFLQQNGITEAQVDNGIARIRGPVLHVTLEDDFVPVIIEGRGLTQLRWSAVAAYSVEENS